MKFKILIYKFKRSAHFISSVAGIEMGNRDQEIKHVDLLSPRYPNFPKSENNMEMRCVIRQPDRGLFRFKTLETWFTFKDRSEHAVNTQFLLITMAESEIITMPIRKVNPFNRYVQFSDVIGKDLNELLVWYSNSPHDLKFRLKIKGKCCFSLILSTCIQLERFCLYS